MSTIFIEINRIITILVLNYIVAPDLFLVIIISFYKIIIIISITSILVIIITFLQVLVSTTNKKSKIKTFFLKISLF